MKNIEGKRLLILGSTSLIAVIVKKAKEMGVYTIVTDNKALENAPAKQIADKYYNISFSDIDAMKKLIKEEKIDGVLTGFTDSYLDYYLKICKETNLPCYGGEYQFKIASDKATFKDACIKSGVPVIPGKSATNLADASLTAREIGYPVFMKPADNSGSRGVIKCETENDLEQCFNYALSFSTIGSVIIEKYMDCDNIAVSYFIADGKIELSSTTERFLYVSPETGSSITSMTLYPSKYTDRYIKEVDACVKKMLIDNNFHDGMISLQAFVDDKSFYFCEMCYRPSGGHHFYFIENQNGIDQLGLLIEYAVTGSCKEDWKSEAETPNFKEYCAMLKIIGEPNKTIQSIEGFENILANVKIISDKAKNKGVVLGSTVTVKDLTDNSVESYTIVGTVEANPLKGLISNVSPLGKAVIDKNVGDIVSVHAIKEYKVEILKIETK